MATTVRVESERWGEILSAVHAALPPVVKAAAVGIQADARSRARVDTSAMQQGLYVSTGTDSGYPDASAFVGRRRPGHVLDETRPETDDGLTAVVAATADYTIEWEYGGRHGIQPMLTPAAETARGPFVRAISEAVREAVRP